MILRPYQREAVNAAYAAMRASAEPTLIVLPTGAGKSAVIATMAKEAVQQWGGRVLILSHVRELIGQVAETIRRVWGDVLAPVGIYSAGLKSRDTADAVICAGIQSVFKRACELGRFDMILVDEAHLISRDGDGMYRQFLADARVINPNVRLVGLTATDFRLDCGYIHGEGKLFGSVCYEAKVRDLINQGFLCELRGKNGGIPDLSGVHMRGGEYIPAELEDVMAEAGKVNAACDEILRYGGDRSAWLVFCCGVKHADMVSKALTARGIEAPVVLGDTPSDERADLIGRYKAKSLRCLVSVGVLTTGFDAPHVDLIALLRPTQSAGLYVQMVGRGLRIEAGKKDCLVLDMAGVITEHGPVDAIEIREKRKGTPCDAPVKTCPQCQEILPASAVVCNGCGFAFPRELAKHDTWAHDVSPLVEHKEDWVDVTEVDWSVHIKKKHNAATGKSEPIEGAPQTLRVDYTYGYHLSHSEWVCFGHSGFARTKAESWWQEVTGLEGWSAPASALAALDALDALRDAKELYVVKRLLLQTGGKFADIIGREYHSRDGGRQPGDDQEEEAPKHQTLKQAVAAYAAEDEAPF